MLRRDLLKGAALAASLPAIPLTAPRLARPAIAASTSRVLRFVPQADVTVTDPVMTTAYITRHHALMVWDQLYGLDDRLVPQPQMVESHTVEDNGLRWTFRLREGLKFHDGEPVRGRDCIASIKRWAARDTLGQALVARTAEMAAPEDRVFTIRLTKPYGLMLETLAKLGPPALVIMPERLANGDPFKPITELVGSGPYRWKADERVVGARVVYERNPDYVPRQGRPEHAAGPKVVHFDRVEYAVMPDPGTAASALSNGEVDWWENPPNDLLPVLRRARGVAVGRVVTTGGMGTGVFNHLHPPFNNPAIRRAVLMASSQADFMTAAAGTDPKMMGIDVGLFTPDTAMASTEGLELVREPRDLEAARKALKEAGYKGEKVVLMSASDNPLLAALGEVGRDLLTKLGMEVDFVVADWGTVVQRRASKEPPAKGGWNMFHTTWNGVDMLNPMVQQTLRANGDKAWFGWPSSQRVEDLRAAWLEAPDLPAQQKIAGQLQRAALEDVVYLPTGQYFQDSAWRSDIRDVVQGTFVFWGVRRG
ncbi:ABC transporter substrate-binding protein [Pseudoroseomonas ludipueritiae]|uniref:ABC transporter substrate-binding protein n=1 Tax=Pseudoroseomonas ludipueritiae TaxID=198093 RepID=A0ABR7R759_9PROT|nr:ABC transporter substrate-binding protein [Pseudoroseomonas ludipueritiae]MBC9177595.1 ABC transporter substrate-binding protein [Pseudoroseomonas ludipueritiae]